MKLALCLAAVVGIFTMATSVNASGRKKRAPVPPQVERNQVPDLGKLEEARVKFEACVKACEKNNPECQKKCADAFQKAQRDVLEPVKKAAAA